MNLTLTLSLASSALFLLLVLVVAGFLMFLRRCFGRPGAPRPRPKQDDAADVECGKPVISTSKIADESAARRYVWAEVEAMTAGFTTEVVGEGGSSTVYLGRLPDSRAVGVKVQRSSERLRRAFLQELDVLLHLRHPNIVSLVGYCADRDEGVLVFDYVPNGTLFDNLQSDKRTPLTWGQRMRIAYGVASAVAHLHGGSGGALQIVHGDLTSSNVLLDGDLKPYLCDLGSALVGFSAAVGPSRFLLLGSPGYADPLLLRTGVVSKKTDIYSFGVLLLELITGTPAFVEEPADRSHSLLTAAVGPVVRDAEGNREKVRGILDRRLEEFDEGELMAVAAVAGRCIGDRPAMRPSMEEILGIMRDSIVSVDGGSDGKGGC
ncbi:putative receptor-like protein kinase [Iris pallida]|uniref:Receptor-like protein kinase n=1 Tax=Iris pallida TaxID=29817 RepID=A0AAX6HWF5_IRIPA|nr:putative receptor-like protein kinase [Iris pallida]